MLTSAQIIQGIKSTPIHNGYPAVNFDMLQKRPEISWQELHSAINIAIALDDFDAIVALDCLERCVVPEHIISVLVNDLLHAALNCVAINTKDSALEFLRFAVALESKADQGPQQAFDENFIFEHPNMRDPLVQKARGIAELDFALARKVRKVPKGSDLTCKGYFSHLEEVARILAVADYSPIVIAAGYLHDHLEDLPKKWTKQRLELEFGSEVAELVSWVTQPNKQHSWEYRNSKYAERLRLAPDEARALSCADKLSNSAQLLVYLRLGYPVSAILCRGWKENSAKLHELKEIYRGHVEPLLFERFEETLTEFDKLGAVIG